MKFAKWFGAAVCGAVMAVAAPVQAATYIITYTGHITSGFDTAGVFGQDNRDLSGLSYTSEYILTDPTPGSIVENDGIYHSIYGGLIYGAPSPLKSSITIDGVTSYINGIYSGISSLTDGVGKAGYSGDIIYNSNTGIDDGEIYKNISNIFGSQITNFLNSANFDSLDYSAESYVGGAGSYDENQYDLSTNQWTNLITANLDVDRVTIVAFSTSAVPEPATWAMMIIGFGAVGGAMRGRNRRNMVVRFT